ncbi:rac GTPase-activating protein 1-like [Venturia canescens]|uniref:rac GTPase-activating protein 1-like n=1 Tax=Venturia canescens TaxID=32260 RepID=UPI001C9D3774|nr:rac GTPase-activating protein 1-like [Venturia canescens]XP_043288339.1 rac GTPase-activating protein 1-like [Venturia canescens]
MDMMASTSYSGESSSSSSGLREHRFQWKIFDNKCAVCHHNIQPGKEVFECGGCHKIVHTACKVSLPVPCVPLTNPKRGTLADYVPDKPPYVPSLVMECIYQVETRGVEKRFLYRKNGDIIEAKRLVKEYLGDKIVPDLSNIDTETVTLTLKLFLTSLSDALITDEVRDDFVEASRILDSKKKHEALCDAMRSLPRFNRDTLNYLLEHLQEIIQEGPSGIFHRLAYVFGPIVVGGSSQYLTPSLFMISREDQIEVFESLLELGDCDDGLWI